MDVRIAGFGGQGVVLSGLILGRAAAIHAGMHATHAQSYGPEARGGAVRSEVVISDKPVVYPRVITGRNDILVALSQEALSRYVDHVKPDGHIIYDPDLILDVPKRTDVKYYKVPATETAYKLGRRIVANIVMLGVLVELTNILPFDAVRKAVQESVPKGTEEINLKALKTGVEIAKGLKERANMLSH